MREEMERFSSTDDYNELEKKIQERVTKCCQVPGALNLPVGRYATNATGNVIGKWGVECLESTGIQGINAGMFSNICKAHLNLKRLNQLEKFSH